MNAVTAQQKAVSLTHSPYLQSETVRLTRKNAEVLPFEAGGEVKLEQFSAQTDCGQFVLATHTKKRPHNLILGRFYDNRLYDLLELGVEGYKSITSFGAAASKVQLNNKVGLLYFIFAMCSLM